MSNLPPHAVKGLIRRINDNTTLAALKAHWHDVATAYQHHPDVKAAKEARKAALS
jgi:uncharacterized protein HemY